MPRAELESWAQARGLGVDDDAWERLEALVGLWQRYGRAFNLVGSIDRAALVEHVREGLMARHVAASLLDPALPVAWIDVGSGGGLPGLVIAASTAWRMLLVEPRERRAAFLELAGATVARGEIRVERTRIERSTWKQSAAVSHFLAAKDENLVASARAVHAPEKWLDIARAGLPPRGIIIVHVVSSVTELGGERPAGREAHADHAVLAFRASRRE